MVRVLHVAVLTRYLVYKCIGFGINLLENLRLIALYVVALLGLWVY